MAILLSSTKLLGGPLYVYDRIQLKRKKERRKKTDGLLFSLVCEPVLKAFLQETN